MVVVHSTNLVYVKYHSKPECVPYVASFLKQMKLKNMYVGKHKDYLMAYFGVSALYFICLSCGTCYILPKATCYTKNSWSNGPDICS